MSATPLTIAHRVANRYTGERSAPAATPAPVAPARAPVSVVPSGVPTGYAETMKARFGDDIFSRLERLGRAQYGLCPHGHYRSAGVEGKGRFARTFTFCRSCGEERSARSAMRGYLINTYGPQALL